MALRDEIREPWGLMIGALAGGLGWAVGIPALGAAAVGAAVYAMKVVVGTLVNPDGGARELSVRPRSEEEGWVRRAERAVRSFRRLGASALPGPISERFGRIGEQAEQTLADVRRLAGQVSSVREALQHVGSARLSEEEARLAEDLARAPGEEVAAEIRRSLGSIRSQLEVRDRLGQAGAKLMARIESVVLGLESLVARLVEVLTLVEAQSPVEGAQRIDELADELEGLRAGLAETEDLSRRALTAYQGSVGSVGEGPGEGGSVGQGRGAGDSPGRRLRRRRMST